MTSVTTLERADIGAAAPGTLGTAARSPVEAATLARWSDAISADTPPAKGKGLEPESARTLAHAGQAAFDDAGQLREAPEPSRGEHASDMADAARRRALAPQPRDAQPREALPQGDETLDAVPPRIGTARSDAGASSALSLRELRAWHSDHREMPFDADPARPDGSRASRDAIDAPPRGELRLLGTVSLTTTTIDQPGPTGATNQLQSLIESCCSRMWVADGTDRAGAPRGVMLDVGSWMPGCTLEVARAAGGFRIVMHGVHDERLASLERDLAGLSAELAESLGCPVVSAVESRGGLR